jgi:hypothetical protein
LLSAVALGVDDAGVVEEVRARVGAVAGDVGVAVRPELQVVSWRSRLRCGSTVGAVWVWAAIAGTGSVNSTLEMVASIFLLFLTCPSPRSKNVYQPT